MKIIITTALFLGLLFPAQAEIFRWVDEAGNVIYSDRPQPGVEEIEKIDLPSGTYYTPPELPEPKPPTPPAKEEAVYDFVEIRQPQQDGTVRDNQGIVQVSIRTVPKLLEEHSYQLYLDGNAIYDPFVYDVVKVPDIDRGTHTLQVKVVDQEGAEIASSQLVTFHLHKASINIWPERAKPRHR